MNVKGLELAPSGFPTIAKIDATVEARIWRELGEHLELKESAQRIFDILSERWPLSALAVLFLDGDPSRLSTVALAAAQNWDRSHFPLRVAAERALLGELPRSEATQPIALSTSESHLARALGLDTAQNCLLLFPISQVGAPPAFALMLMSESTHVTPFDLGLVAPLIPPLRAAYENDHRLQELARMREALEADRAALLSKLERDNLSELVIGESGGLAGVMERIEQVAPTDAPVLILGETGSGKEVIARALHERSRRSKGPVVRVNCGAIPSELVDSELFGHEKGSFTGATGTRKGWFERADGGTLFLDEIGELPLAAQVRLLRVLQDGTLERVGGHETISVDVRIVAATHRYLETMVADGKFREDLWYRLSVFPVQLPALRERMQDLPALAASFADRAGKRLGGSGLTPTSRDLELLSNYSWPGNVRELAAVIERATILGNGKRLEVEAALGASSLRTTSQPPPPLFAVQTQSEASKPIMTLQQAMADHIRLALETCHGRIEGPFGAAKILDINPHTLRARMRKLGIEWSQFRGNSQGTL